MTPLNRGDIYDADLPGAGPHPVVVVTRQAAIPVLSTVTVVLVTSTIRGHPAEVPLGIDDGLDHDSVANCDNIFTLTKTRLHRYRGHLSPPRQHHLNTALRIALDLD